MGPSRWRETWRSGHAAGSQPARHPPRFITTCGAPPMSQPRLMRSRFRWCWTRSTTNASPAHCLLGAIREFDASEWGMRRHTIRDSIVELVEAEVSRFPDEVGHILKLRDVRGDRFLADLVWKGRDAISDSTTFCKRLIGQA